jgi:FkbM family methyltransferase
LKRQLNHFRELLQHPAFRSNPWLLAWRVAAWGLHCAFGVPAHARFARWNFRLWLPPRWQGAGATTPFLFREHYEPELALLERFLLPGAVFVDVGANTGVYTFTASRLVGETGRVLAFEPGAASFAALEKSKALNGTGNVVLVRKALGDRDGAARLYHHLAQANSFSIAPPDANAQLDSEPAEVTTLSRAFAEHGLSRLDFIKLDIDGAEELVLRPARDLLAQYRPVVLFEPHPDGTRRLGLDPDGAARLLCELGYELYGLAAGQLVPVAETSNPARVIALPTTAAPNR